MVPSTRGVGGAPSRPARVRLPPTPMGRVAPMAATREKWSFQWKELYEEVIDTGLCTGCAGCVIACPHDVIGYEHEPGKYTPFHLEEDLGETDCGHGQKGCTSCTRACPRFRSWETEADQHLFGQIGRASCRERV